MHITAHAVTRYQERVEQIPESEVRARILACRRAIDKAAEFGCGCVICGDGTRLKLKGKTVVTVIGKWERG